MCVCKSYDKVIRITFARGREKLMSGGGEGGFAVLTDGWMDACGEGGRARTRDAEGKRWYIHSSSGIYSRPEERRVCGRGLVGFMRWRGREWEESSISGVRGRLFSVFGRRGEERRGGRAVFESETQGGERERDGGSVGEY